MIPELDKNALTSAIHRIKSLEEERDSLRSRIARLEGAFGQFLDDFDALVAQSGGVAGLHLNGEVAPWSELLPAGRYEGWLTSLTEARAALQPPQTDGEKGGEQESYFPTQAEIDEAVKTDPVLQNVDLLLRRSPPPQKPEGGWMAIETAPKDGEVVLLHKPDERRSGPFTLTGFWHSEGYWWPCAGAYAVKPTHWQPLPTPPAQASATSNEGGEG